MLADVFGSPNIGIYCFCNDQLLAVPLGLPAKRLQKFQECLKTGLCETSIGGSTLLGVLTVANSVGILVPHIISPHELEKLKSTSKAPVEVVEEKWTAFGNLILANDHGALIHPEATPGLKKTVKDVLGVEVLEGTINGMPYVGALAVATNKSVLAHPQTSTEEIEVLESLLKVPVELGTTNGGVPFVKAGIVANSKGAIAGPLTRGGELMAITRFLGTERGE